ncbi:hypothetical protein BJV78DRAFT_1287383 [Lactifluus subvellereus]|nr:hypothetical protein BJV78DRAFT_1287383 [Lactifluus subvellereus]
MLENIHDCTPLIPHADVVFLNRTYAQAQSPAYANAPRAFLLALTRLAPSHALLVAYWGADGPAALSVPTREYFQSSGWTAPPTPAGAASPSSSSTISASTNATPSAPRRARVGSGAEEAESVRTGSGFWAAGHDSSHGSSAFSASQLLQLTSPQADDLGDDSDGTEIVVDSNNDGLGAAVHATVVLTWGQQPLQQQQQQQQQRQCMDNAEAQSAFVLGMIYKLNHQLLPGAPYTPSLAGAVEAQRTDGGQWKLDECLRLATELAGRRAHRCVWDGLGEEMTRAGWFDG